MRFLVRHETKYAYGDKVSVSLNQACVLPRGTDFQRVLESSLAVQPEPSTLSHRQDYFGNHLACFSLARPHAEMTVLAKSRVELAPRDFSAAALQQPWENAAASLRNAGDAERLDAFQFLFDSPAIRRSAAMAGFARTDFVAGRPLLEAVLALTHRIHDEFEYDPNATHTATKAEEAFELHKGVCQDFAQVQVGCLRSLGLAARYVSGYLLTRPPPGMPRLVGADASHAWLSVYCPGWGWIDCDPTNGILVDQEHITVGWGRDYFDLTPVKGVILGGGRQSMTISVDVSAEE